MSSLLLSHSTIFAFKEYVHLWQFSQLLNSNSHDAFLSFCCSPLQLMPYFTQTVFVGDFVCLSASWRVKHIQTLSVKNELIQFPFFLAPSLIQKFLCKCGRLLLSGFPRGLKHIAAKNRWIQTCFVLRVNLLMVPTVGSIYHFTQRSVSKFSAGSFALWKVN